MTDRSGDHRQRVTPTQDPPRERSEGAKGSSSRVPLTWRQERWFTDNRPRTVSITPDPGLPRVGRDGVGAVGLALIVSQPSTNHTLKRRARYPPPPI